MRQLTIIRIEAPDGYGMFSDLNSDNNSRDIKSVNSSFLPNIIKMHSNFPVPQTDNINLKKDQKEWRFTGTKPAKNKGHSKSAWRK